MRIKWYYFSKNEFSTLIIRFFWQKIKKISTLEKLENLMKQDCFFEYKMFSTFQKPSLQKKEGTKYAGDSRTSCLAAYVFEPLKRPFIKNIFNQLRTTIFITVPSANFL